MSVVALADTRVKASGFASGVVGGAQLPLALVSEGSSAKVARVKGAPACRQHLAELGFVTGALVRVVSRAGGDVIVSIKGATVALNRQMAMHVVTA